MIFRKGNMFEESGADVLLVTTNSFITKDGNLAMGRGAAKKLKESNAGIDTRFGTLIKRHYEHLGLYGTMILEEQKGRRYGAFQVKRHFKDAADIDIIAISASELFSVAVCHPETLFAVNFPGIGNGKLPRDVVMEKAMYVLKNCGNVEVWEY